MITRLKLLSLLLGLLLVHKGSCQCTPNGTVESDEECDDLIGTNCTDCGYNVVVDLNSLDQTTTNYTMEFFDLDAIVYLANISNFDFRLSALRNWTSIFLVMIGDPLAVDDEIDVFTREAFREKRTSQDFTGYFTTSPLIGPNDPRLLGLTVDMSSITAGVVVTGNDGFPLGDGDRRLSSEEVDAVIRSAGYIARSHPGYNPRVFCIVGDDGVTSDAGCVGLDFIGRNDNPPVITYSSDGVVVFTEGDTEYIPIVDGTFTITDQDHPTRYLQMSARATIANYVPGYPEFLRLTDTPPGFISVFNETTGVLTISGEAAPEVYESILLNLTYLNTMMEPSGNYRDIEVTMFDGIHTSAPAIVRVDINNTNDAPAISLDGAAPIVTSLSLTYIESAMATTLVPNLNVIDVDPNAMIQRIVVMIINILDPGQELLNVSRTPSGPDVTSEGAELRLEGARSVAVYTDTLRTLTYQHLSGNPGNPTTNESRIITFYIEDTAGAPNNLVSTINLTIIPVNDAPILLFVSNASDRQTILTTGQTSATFMYREDDPALIVGGDVYLRDVDSDITSVTISMSNLLNGDHDIVTLDEGLLAQNGVTMATLNSTSADTRTILLSGVATPTQYEQILQSLSYRNFFTNNSVMNGVRTIMITANDTYEAVSNSISITIDVSFRNDGPVLNIGAGANMDYMITFVEGGFSIPIVLQHVLSLMDEESHNISRVTIQLSALNGDLDSTDILIPRTPFPMQFVDNLFQPLTDTTIDIAANGTMPSELYRSVLASIYYSNDADEPTLFNATGSPLVRVISISIYDERFDQRAVDLDGSVSMGVTNVTVGVDITPVNDHVPMIVLRAEPAGCTGGGSSTSGVLQRARRSTSWALASSRRRAKKMVDNYDDSKAPKVSSAIASFTDEDCLHLVTLSFNTPTNAPIVATKLTATSLLTFDSPEVNSAIRLGVWLDYDKMVVVFGDCVKKRTVQGLRERGVKVYLDADRGSCDWTSTCSDHLVCFKNLTGCPASGPYPITMETPCSSGSSFNGKCSGSNHTTETTPTDAEDLAYSKFALTSVLLTLMVIFAVFLVLMAKSCIRTSRVVKTSKTESSFKESTDIDMPQIEEKFQIDSCKSAAIQEVKVIPFLKVASTPSQETFKPRSKSPSQNKERRRQKREKIKREQSSREDISDRIPILQDECSSEDDDSDDVTIFPEGKLDDRFQSKCKPFEVTPHPQREMHSGGEKHPSKASQKELGVDANSSNSPTSIGGASNR